MPLWRISFNPVQPVLDNARKLSGWRLDSATDNTFPCHGECVFDSSHRIGRQRNPASHAQKNHRPKLAWKPAVFLGSGEPSRWRWRELNSRPESKP